MKRTITKHIQNDLPSKIVLLTGLHQCGKKTLGKQLYTSFDYCNYDAEGIPPELLVTGSAKLDTYRKVGDSLAGRYFQYRLHPLDLHEVAQFSTESHESIFQALWDCGGFPEPFIKNNKNYYQRWRRTHTDIILRQDLVDLHAVKDIQSIETLVLLLQSRVGSTTSHSNLARV
ncbi:MAG: hypothetical protein NTZ67_02730 [Gammaproteobacteria bacterium]|nr:hypothetical protein [Gammaproteobacteria bacterium]